MPISRQIDMSSLASHYYFDYWFHLELRALLIKVSEVCHSANDIAFNVIASLSVWRLFEILKAALLKTAGTREPPVSVSRYRFIRDVIFVSANDNETRRRGLRVKFRRQLSTHEPPFVTFSIVRNEFFSFHLSFDF